MVRAGIGCPERLHGKSKSSMIEAIVPLMLIGRCRPMPIDRRSHASRNSV